MEEKIRNAAHLIAKAKHVTVFTGAGVSVESGIASFRGEDGLWNRYDPTMLEINYFFQYPEKVWPVLKKLFYDEIAKARPNKAHLAIAELEKWGLVKAVITQNIDYLHQTAGSRVVYEFHGTINTLICLRCQTLYEVKKVDWQKLPPLCPRCQSVLKPNFIFFGEAIPRDAREKSFAEAKLADVFLVIGTSGEVMPAGMIPRDAKMNGAMIIEINPAHSAFTHGCTDLFIQGPAGEIMHRIHQEVWRLIENKPVTDSK